MIDNDDLRTKVHPSPEGFDFITEYIKREYNIGPVKKGTKDQFLFNWGEYKNKKATKEQIMKWRGQFSSDWVMICGEYNNSIIVIDFDDPEIYERYFSDYKKMLSRSPSGGYHLFLKTNKPSKPINGFGGFLLDIKGEGSVCHIPPSEGNEWIYFESEPDEIDLSVENWVESLLPVSNIDSKFKTGFIPISIMDYAKDKLKVSYEDKKGRYLKCVCPFHRAGTESDGSLTIFAHDQKFWCFSCHKKGGMFELVKEIEGINENEILERYGLIKDPETIVQRCIQIARRLCTFVKNQNNETYAIIDEEDQGIEHNICQIGSREFKYWLEKKYEDLYENFPGGNPTTQAIKHLDGFAIGKGERIQSFNRIGSKNSREIVYDLCNEGRYLKITPESFDILKKTDLFFSRESHQGIQIIPTKFDPQNAMKLFRVLNIKKEKDKLLLITWLVTAFLPGEEHPILIYHGSQGAGKSVAARFTKRLIDPTSSQKNELSRMNKKDQNQITFTMAHNFVVVFDNISYTDKDIDDILCLGVTGGSELKRALFTNGETINTDIASTIILTTINPDLITAGDLGDRSIQIELDRPVGNFLNRSFVDKTFNEVKADVFGGLIALVQIYLQRREELESQPSNFRMTTYSAVGKVVAEVLDLGSFENAYMEDQLTISKSVLDNEPLSAFIYHIADKYPDKGFSFTDLMKELGDWTGEQGINIGMGSSREWPNSAKAMSQKIKRLEEDLRKSWKIITTRCDVGKSRGVSFSKPGSNLIKE